jgi:pyridinium-3,5-bisthiocarboxylic acid mononucleotide nickel chelatase
LNELRWVGLPILYFDCFSGAAGDMVVGSLIDAGVPLDEIRRALGSLAIAPDVVWTERVTRAGVSATRFCVQGETHPVDHAHDHESGHHDHSHVHHHHEHEEVGHHVHRTLSDISRLIEGSALSGAGKDRAKHLFRRLGEAEAAIHGTSLERVHLHEVGALDSIIDIVSAVHALEWLNVDRVVASPLNVGGGRIRSAHGVYPVPAPATLRLLEEVPIYDAGPQVELVTPTGALLVTDYAAEFGSMPPMRVQKIGYGAGTRDFPDRPNVLRVVLGAADATVSSTSVVMIEAEIDDMNPQIFGLLMDRLLADGALDVFYTAIQMKKNRPGTLLTIIAPPAARERLTAMVFRETTTIGVRYREMNRECLDRETIDVDSPLGTIRFKVARRGDEILNAAPEFEDCVRIATASGRALKDVQALAMKAFLDQRPETKHERPDSKD